MFIRIRKDEWINPQYIARVQGPHYWGVVGEWTVSLVDFNGVVRQVSFQDKLTALGFIEEVCAVDNGSQQPIGGHNHEQQSR